MYAPRFLASFIMLAGAAMLLGILAGTQVAFPAECETQTINEARDVFSGHGDRFGVGPVTDKSAVTQALTRLGAPLPVAERDGAAAEFIAVGVVGKSRGRVSLGLFDADECAIGSANGVPIAFLVGVLGPQTPVPKPSGPSI